MAHSHAFVALSVVSITIVAGYLLLALFGPVVRYRITRADPPSDPRQLSQTLEVLCDSQMHCNTRIGVLTNGVVFYEAELEAIARARRSVNLLAYIF